MLPVLGMVSMGLSLIGASEAKNQSQVSMTAAGKAASQQIKIGNAERQASAASTIAQVNSQNYKVQELKYQVDIMKRQGKADAMIRNENYNDMMATAVVMGAASGRVMGEGSIQAIMDKSETDYAWDQMWASTNIEIAEGAMYQDMSNVYLAGGQSLALGAQSLGIQRDSATLGGEQSRIGFQGQADQIQNTFNASINKTVANYGSAYGNTLFGRR